MKTTLGLRGRLILLLLAGFAAFISFLAWDYVIHRDERIESTKAELLDEVRAIAARQESIAARADAILTAMMLIPEMRPGASAAACSRFLSERLVKQRWFVQGGRTLPDGELACSAVPAGGRVSYADRGWLKAARDSQAMVVSEVIIGRTVPNPMIVFAKAMRDEGGRVTGVLFLALDLKWLHGELAAGHLPAGARLVVVDGKGIVAVRHPDPDGLVGTRLRNERLLQRIRDAGGEGIAEEADMYGKTRLFAYAKLLDTTSGPMYLWLAMPKDAIEAPARHTALLGLGFAMALALVAAGLVVWGGNRLVLGPLRRLSQAATRFGAGDFSVRTGLPHTDDELGRLARTLDETAEAIEDRERSLVRANRTLRVHTAVNQALLRAGDETALMAAICQVIVEGGAYRFAWVGTAEDDGRVRLAASWGAPADFLAGLDVTWDDSPKGRGPTGSAIRRRAAVACNDTQTAPDYALWREQARRHGYAASLALPLLADDATLGALNIYAAEADAFDTEVKALLGEAANDLAFGIVALRVKAEKQRMQLAMEQRLDELRRFQDVAVGRELQMKALVEENERLKATLAKTTPRPQR